MSTPGWATATFVFDRKEFYLDDVGPVEAKVERYLQPIESVAMKPDSEWSFCYFGHHLMVAMPQDLLRTDIPRSEVPEFFEIQIKTVFQHAWSEANHDLGYKAAEPLTEDQSVGLLSLLLKPGGQTEPFQNYEGSSPHRATRPRLDAMATLTDDLSLYFDLAQEHELVALAQMIPTKPPESQPRSVDRAVQLMAEAATGSLDKRPPLLVRDLGGGLVEIIDGNATFGAALRNGLQFLPVVRESPT